VEKKKRMESIRKKEGSAVFLMSPRQAQSVYQCKKKNKKEKREREKEAID
jgi:hypothetical protein